MAVKGLLQFLFEQGSKPDNLLRLGFLKPESLANATAVKTAQTKYKKSLENPAVAAREEGRLLNSPVINQGALPERKIIRPEDVENTILVSHKGDTSSTDTELLEMAGIKFDNPPESRGGVRFGDSPKTPEELYWASMATGAVPLQNKAEGLMATFDMPVTGVFGSMGDEAMFFNDAISNTMLQWTQKLQLPKKAIAEFDADMRKTKKDWVGINHPDARDQLLGVNGYPREGAGKFRSRFASRMSMAGYRDLGFPSIGDVKSVYREPGLANTNLGDSGYVMGKIGQGYGLTKDTNHLSYDTGIMGEGIGGFEQSLPNRIAYPDAYKKLENELTKPKDPTKTAPRLFTESEKVDAIGKRKDLFQIADARWVDTASKWLEDNKGATNAALIAAVGLPAAMQSEQTEAGPAGLLRNVMPAPQRMFDPANKDYKPFLSSFGETPGGRYLEMGPDGPVDITGQSPASANISVGPDGKPKFQVAGEERKGTPPNKGRKVKTNLFKKKAGWKWSKVPEGYDPEPAGDFPIVSVQDGKKHYYTVDAQFPDGVDLTTYPNSASEPRLRPTRKGSVELGDQIGEIDVRGKKHPVYSSAVIRQAAPVAMTGILGAGMSDESDAGVKDVIASLVQRGVPESTAAKIASGELPMDQASRMERASQQGYDLNSPQYHGTASDYVDSQASREGNLGPGFYTTPDSDYAASRSMVAKYKSPNAPNAGQNVIPMVTRQGNYLDLNQAHSPNRYADNDAQQYLIDEGYDGIRRSIDGELIETNTFNPANVRSVHAAFDPDQKGSRNMLASVAGAGLLSGVLGTEQAQAAEYREAPVVEETSFGDMIQEYADINQRTEAAEDQKFDALMREDARLREMGSASFGKLSPELAAYRRSQILPGVGELGMGVLGGAVDSLDFLSQIPSSIASMRMPERTPLRDRLGGLLDYNFMDKRNQKAIDEARFIGGLLSPI